MCGLVALLPSADNGPSFQQKKWFDDAMTCNQFRGMHSTGAYSVAPDGDFYWSKVIGGFGNLYQGKTGKMLEDHIYHKGRIIVGHGRFATRGKHDDLDCAHPFEVSIPDTTDSIVLVHNGTLQNYQPFYEGLHKAKVDSLWMAELIAAKGWQEVLPRVKGAIATMWWNSQEKKFFLYRNNERPLVFARGKDGSYYVCSEKAILSYARFKSENKDLELDTMAPVQSGKLYIIDPTNLQHEVHPIEEVKQTVTSTYFTSRTQTPKGWQHPIAWDAPDRSINWARINEYEYIRTAIKVGLIKRVVCTGTDRKIHVHRFNYMYTIPGEPYEEDLQEISLSNDGKHFHKLYKDDRIVLEELEKAPPPLKLTKRMVVDRFGNRRSKLRLKFGDKDSIQKITSDTDGNVEVGQKRLCEVYEVEEVGQNLYEVSAVPVHTSDTGLYQVKFYIPRDKVKTKEDIFSSPFVDVTLTRILPAANPSPSKPVFVAYGNNPEPIDMDNTLEEEDASCLVVS